MSNTRSLPKPAPAVKPKDVFDLDVLEREGGPAKPFAARMQGQTFTFVDPSDLDWRELSDIAQDDLRSLFSLLLSDEDYAAFMKLPLPQWKVNALAEALTKHYGLGDQGEDSASSGS